jgi:hypothetical protein
MKSWIWLIVAAVGWTMMLAGYKSRPRIDSTAPWSSGLIVIGPIGSAQNGGRTAGEKKAAAEKPTSTDASTIDAAVTKSIPVRLRLLSASDVAEFLMIGMGDGAPDKAVGTKAAVRVKLIEVPLKETGLAASSLQSGRLPEPGHDEILAGAKIEPRDELIVGGHKLKVVGVLKPDVALFSDSYLVPSGGSTSELFRTEIPSVYDARLVRLPAAGQDSDNIIKELEKAFPADRHARYATEERLDPRSFYLYVAGLALLLLGGSGALIEFYRWLADRPVISGNAGPRFLTTPLLEMKQRPGLLWTVHVVYFGLVIAGSVLIYELPAVQTVLMGKLGEAVSTKNNVLGIAAAAYRTRNILLAAGVTFLVNFFGGSLAYITLPSVILFGAGLLLTLFRAIMWGVLFAPGIPGVASSMLPHSGTMLLEGAGYILAAFFAALIPIHTFSSRLGGNPLSRWGRALLLNLTGSFWVALVLVVAALYEATEVIWMMR